MLIKSNNRKEAYDAVINMALKNKEIFEDTKAIIAECKRLRETLHKDTGANEKNTWRMALKIPKSLFQVLDKYEEKHNGEFLKTKEDVDWFAKNYPQFRIPSKY